MPLAPDEAARWFEEQTGVETDDESLRPSVAWKAFSSFAGTDLGPTAADGILLFERSFSAFPPHGSPRDPRTTTHRRAIVISLGRHLTLRGEHRDMEHLTVQLCYPDDLFGGQLPDSDVSFGEGGAAASTWVSGVEASEAAALLARDEACLLGVWTAGLI